MSDPLLSIWPQDTSRRIVNAEAQVVSKYQGAYRIAFTDSAGKQLLVQLPLSALRNVAKTARALVE